MAGRGHIPPPYGGRSTQAPGMMRHGSFPAGHRIESLPPSDLDNKLIAQAAEIERLAGDNHRLAATHVALRQDLVATQQEIQQLRSHIGSTQTESDIQVRVLLDKIANMDADIRGGENVRKNSQAAHIEARSLVSARQELNAKIQQASQELEKVRAEVKKIPEMHGELDSLRKEHQRLRSTFEHEKGLNMEKVEQMRAMEKDLVGMAREVEKLRAEVSNAENRALGNPTSLIDVSSLNNATPSVPKMNVRNGSYMSNFKHSVWDRAPNPYGGHYMHPEPLYPPVPPHPDSMHPPVPPYPEHMGGGYVDPYRRPMGVGPTSGGYPLCGNTGWGGTY